MTSIQALSDTVTISSEKEEVISEKVDLPQIEEKQDNEVEIDRSIDARQRILTVATSMFSSNGYDGVSTTQIAKASGVTQPLIHYHFKSKFSLWKACVSQAFDWLQAEFVQRLKTSLTSDHRMNVEIMVKSFVNFAASRPEFSRFLLSEGSQDSERLNWMVNEYVKPLTSDLEKIYIEGVSSGYLRNMPLAQLVSIVLGAATQFYAWKPMLVNAWSVDPEDAEQAKIQEEVVVEFIKNAVLA